jgi:hypothetical protein
LIETRQRADDHDKRCSLEFHLGLLNQGVLSGVKNKKYGL